MRRHSPTSPPRQPEALTLAACTWLASGVVLLGLTPLPLHDASWGWSPVFWLLLAPAIMLCARRLSAQRLPIREAATGPRAPRHNLLQTRSGVARSSVGRNYRVSSAAPHPGKGPHRKAAA